MHRTGFLLFEAAPTTQTGKFSGVAYSGGRIDQWGGIVIDLSTTKVEPKMPVLLEHDPGKVAGTIDSHRIDMMGLAVEGELFADIDDEAKAVVAKSKRGARYQMSVGLFNFDEFIVKAGSSVNVNGRDIAGPVLVLKNGTVREVSIVALGADPNTKVHFFSLQQGATTMLTPEQLAQENATLTATNTTQAARIADLEAQVNTLSGQVKASAAVARTSEVKTLFASIGREFKDGDEKPYLAMAAEDFAAVSKQLQEIAPKGTTHDAALFGHVTGDGAGLKPTPGLLLSLAQERSTAAKH